MGFDVGRDSVNVGIKLPAFWSAPLRVDRVRPLF